MFSHSTKKLNKRMYAEKVTSKIANKYIYVLPHYVKIWTLSIFGVPHLCTVFFAWVLGAIATVLKSVHIWLSKSVHIIDVASFGWLNMNRIYHFL